MKDKESSSTPESVKPLQNRPHQGYCHAGREKLSFPNYYHKDKSGAVDKPVTQKSIVYTFGHVVYNTLNNSTAFWMLEKQDVSKCLSQTLPV